MVEAREAGAHGHSRLLSEFQASLGYVVPDNLGELALGSSGLVTSGNEVSCGPGAWYGIIDPGVALVLL